jgi:hypothetical protein
LDFKSADSKQAILKYYLTFIVVTAPDRGPTLLELYQSLVTERMRAVTIPLQLFSDVGAGMLYEC